MGTVRFKDSEVVEGLMPADLTRVDTGGMIRKSTRSQVEYTKNLRTAHGARISHRAGSNWRRPVISVAAQWLRRQVPMFEE